MRLTVIALVAGIMAGPAFAQEHQHDAPTCAAMDVALPAGLGDWNGGAAITTAPSPEHAGHVRLTLGKGYEAALKKKADIAFAVAPEKPGGSVSYSGLFGFTVEIAGDYMVALGAAAWIDVLENGKALEPVSFGHGPKCTTIRKRVVFGLKPGMHVLQVAGIGADTLGVMVVKAP